MLLLVTALLALLPLLAVLQYRWLGQVSEGERERMKNNLNASARQFSQEFDNELTAIYLLFQPTVNPLNNQIQNDFAERYRPWRDSSAHPGLVKDVYQTQSGEDGGSGVTRLNVSKGVFEPCEWPESLSRLRKTFEGHRASRESLRLILREVIEQKDTIRGKAMVVKMSADSVDADLPGLIIPIIDFDEKEALPAFEPKAYRIVALDAEYIKRELIPELAGRHFGDVASDYKLAVTKRDPDGQIIYRSDEGISEKTLANADVTEGLLRIRLNEADRFFTSRLPHGNAPASGDMTQKRKHIAINVASDIRLRSGENPMVPLPPGSPNLGDTVRSALGRRVEGAWQLIIKHREGSLEVAVANGRRRNLAISFGILLLLGASVGFIVLSSRRAERLAIQQMEFVAGVSHELRTPLAVICSAGENLADGVIDNRDQIQGYGGLIRDEGRRLTGMVEQVLEFAGAKSGRKTYELRKTEVNRVIEDAVSACHLQLAEGRFEIERKIAADLPIVKADAAALNRAIQNLLSNAIKYSPHSRWIGLSAETVKTADGVEVQIRVSDRGIGIAPSDLTHIFEPFYRSQEVTAAQIRGNGLGLSLVKHIVAEHGGRVSVESKIGQGSKFTLHLPGLIEKEPRYADEMASSQARIRTEL